MYLRAVLRRVDHKCQPAIPRPLTRLRSLAALPLQVGRVAVMAVRDERSASCKVCHGRRERLAVGDGPESVLDAVRGRRLGDGLTGIDDSDELTGRTTPVVDEVDGLEVGP